MVKRIIKKIKNMYLEATTEEKYINEITQIQKECWKSNMNQEIIFRETIEHLNKLKLSKERHLFLINFRDDMNKLISSDVFDAKEANELLNLLYDYRKTGLKKKLT